MWQLHFPKTRENKNKPWTHSTPLKPFARWIELFGVSEIIYLCNSPKRVPAKLNTSTSSLTNLFLFHTLKSCHLLIFHNKQWCWIQWQLLNKYGDGKLNVLYLLNVLDDWTNTIWNETRIWWKLIIIAGSRNKYYSVTVSYTQYTRHSNSWTESVTVSIILWVQLSYIGCPGFRE